MSRWTDVVIALLVALPATLAAIGALIATVRGNQQIQEVAASVNGRLEQLMAARSEVAHDRGYIQGGDDQRDREDRDTSTPDAG